PLHMKPRSGGLTHPPFTPRKPCQPTTTNEEPSVDVFPAQRQLVATDERACAPLTDKKRILMKLDLRDRVQAVIYVYETGLNQPAQRERSRPRLSARSSMPAPWRTVVV